MFRPSPALRAHGLFLLAAATGVGLTYAGSLDLGLWWDDYVALRPRAWPELAGVWMGPWDAWQFMGPFYRPVSAWYFALGFQLFGLNAWAHHLVSLAALTALGWLLATVVRREIGSVPLAAFAACLFGAHPIVADAEGPWFIRQNHMLCTAIVLVAIRVWQQRRDQPRPGAWWPLVALAALGLATREDLVMLLPALVALQAVRARVAGDVPAPSRGLVGATVGVLVVLIALRGWLLGGLGGNGLPSIGDAAANFSRGIVRVLFVFERTNAWVHATASLASTAVLAAGTWLAWRRGPAPIRGLLLTGVTLFLAFNVPLALASSNSRYHLLAMSAIVMLTAAVGAISNAIARPGARAWLRVSVAAVLVATMSLSSRSLIADLRPCAPDRLGSDGDLVDWPVVPREIRQWIAEAPRRCELGIAPALVDALDVVVWGAREDSADADVRQFDGSLVALVNRSFAWVTLTLRSEGASANSPRTIIVAVNGVEAHRVELTSSDWHEAAMPLAGSAWTRWRAMHRVDVRVERGAWADRDAIGTDHRPILELRSLQPGPAR